MTETNERAVLAVILHKPNLAPQAFAKAPVETFTGPQAILAEAIQGLRVARKPIDPTTVTDEMRRRSTLSRVGVAYPHEVYAEYISAETLDYHLEILADHRRLEKLTKIGNRLMGLASADDADSRQIAHLAAESLQGVIDNIEADQDVTTETMREFLAHPEEERDWTIPGLLERGDRFMLTGSEGAGKSVLFRQMAVGAAAGIHPFTQERIPPQRVLYVDVENGQTKLRRALRQLGIAAKQTGGDPLDNLFIECRPSGLDLTRPEDELWLISRVVALQPSILVIGPVYRLHAKNPNDEEPARQVTVALDRCRAASNCSLVIEAHAGHAVGGDGKRNVRPTGTSLWLRWPEFGYGLRPSADFTPENRLVDLVPWRGDRDERNWPKRMKAGGAWPWSVATDPNAPWISGMDRSAS